MINNIYLGCALTHVSEEIFDDYSELIRIIAKSFEVEFGAKVYYALEDSDPQLASKLEKDKPKLCYLWDREMVESSDLMLAEVSFPSTGLGQELQIAQSKNIPIILFYKDYRTNIAHKKYYVTSSNEECELQIGNGIVSIMVQGNPSVIHEVQYTDASLLVSSLIDITKKFFNI
ncbi:hypothetical protein V9K20_003607 [Vibrio cholerae]|uniref:hypothetical protein n=1 Tax=Vibrio cholerae TaxID=666 RepID=UPI001581A41D|nr:hypothetical protein [Vibrio cholerae]EGR4455605.1 hypothetical protein [Vibrio cholerae]ELH5152301.1 hypothetical protein [Vibrio cholerae]ELL7182943.1 hypothetical protein [Vibrio cholerae]MDV2348096.1 hypothetical protein [Vibrio cholerae]QKU91012.1 hypothetical protein HPY16_15415 [Vibrio cholerae]